jgi:hypothetical protein
MHQQLSDHAIALGGQAYQHIFELGIRVMSIELGALNQTHDGRTPLARTHRTRKQPIVPAAGNRANLILIRVGSLTSRSMLYILAICCGATGAFADR